MNAEVTGPSFNVNLVPLRTLLGVDWDCAVRTTDGTTIAEIRVITPEVATLLDESSPLIGTLCNWRNENAHCFLDSSRVTPESTLRWLQDLTCSPDRLFFLIHTNDGRPVAQYGLRRLSSDVVELDNGILGGRDIRMDLFYRSQLRILNLCRSRLGFVEGHARVLANNVPALFLHKRCGLEKMDSFKGQGPLGQDVLLVGVRLGENFD